MRCRRARRLMLLYREGDLSPERRAALTRHYTSCAECAREAKQVVADFAPLDALRHMQPVLDEPYVLTLRIMREIEAAQEPAPAVVPPLRYVERFLPVIRLAGAAASIVLVLLYATLSYTDARTLASLEERFRHSGREAGSTAEQLAREATSQLEGRNRSPYAEAGLRPDEVRRALQSLLSQHQEPAQVTIQDFLLRKYPALASVTLQDGLDDRERAVLANEGERFLKDLERLIRKEETTHER